MNTTTELTQNAEISTTIIEQIATTDNELSLAEFNQLHAAEIARTAKRAAEYARQRRVNTISEALNIALVLSTGLAGLVSLLTLAH